MNRIIFLKISASRLYSLSPLSIIEHLKMQTPRACSFKLGSLFIFKTSFYIKKKKFSGVKGARACIFSKPKTLTKTPWNRKDRRSLATDTRYAFPSSSCDGRDPRVSRGHGPNVMQRTYMYAAARWHSSSFDKKKARRREDKGEERKRKRAVCSIGREGGVARVQIMRRMMRHRQHPRTSVAPPRACWTS